MYAGTNILDLTKDTIYKHPAEKVCEWLPDLSSYTQILFGSFYGNATTKTIDCGFMPILLICVMDEMKYSPVVAVRGCSEVWNWSNSQENRNVLTWGDTYVSIKSSITLTGEPYCVLGTLQS